MHEASELFQKDRSRLQGDEKTDDMTAFYKTPPNIRHGTTAYIAKAVLSNLLDGEVKIDPSDTQCCIS